MTSFVECDCRQCPARATTSYVRGLLELTFCNHHSRVHNSALRAVEWEPVSLPSEKKDEAHV